MKEVNMEKRIGKVWIIACCILLFSLAVYPQIRESGAIQGNVEDQTKVPLPGVNITLTGESLLGGARTIVTGVKGFYRFPSLPPGNYVVKAEIAGFNTSIREGIRLHAGVILTVDFALEEARQAVEIEVTAVTPTIDVKSSSMAPVVMTDDLLLSIPTYNDPDSHVKSFVGSINLAPGMDYHSAYGSGYASPNAYQMDGINTKSPGWGGPQIEPDFNIIREASVQRFGLGAEYGEFTGVVFNAITKSGSNKISILGELRYNGKSWNSDNITGVPDSKLLDPSMKAADQYTNSLFDASFQIGGPLQKDRLWFFLSGAYYRSSNFPPGAAATPTHWSPKFFGKLSFQVNSSNRVNFGFNYDLERAKTILAGPQFTAEVNLDNHFPGYIVNTNWTSIFSPTTYLDVKFGYNYKNENQLPSSGKGVAGHYDLLTYTYSGNWSSFYENESRTTDIMAQLSHYVPEFISGSHDFKAGIEYQWAKVAQGGGYNGPDHAWYLDYGGQPYLQYQYEDNFYLDNYFKILIGFVQDNWTITKRLTLNLGARFDNYRYNIPSPGPGEVFNDFTIAPRLGFTFDLFGDRQTVLKGSFGHYYESLYRSYFYYADTRRPTLFRKSWDGTQYVTYQTVLGRSYSVDPNTKQPYSREFMVGLERELFKDASISLTYFYRTLERAIGTVNTAGQYQKITIANPGPDAEIGTGDDSTIDVWNQTNPGQVQYLITNPRKGQYPAVVEDLTNRTTGIEIVFNKRFSNRWQAIVSYAYLSVKGNVLRPPVADIFDPNYFINMTGNFGGLPHNFKVIGNVLLPLDISLGISASYISPMTIRPNFGAFLSQGYVTVYTQPYGEIKVDPQRLLNLMLEKRFRISNATVTVFGEVFNFLNAHDTRWEYETISGYGPSYLKITSVQDPRTYRMGFRIMY